MRDSLSGLVKKVCFDYPWNHGRDLEKLFSIERHDEPSKRACGGGNFRSRVCSEGHTFSPGRCGAGRITFPSLGVCTISCFSWHLVGLVHETRLKL